MEEKKGKVSIKSYLDKGFYWEITNIKDVPIAMSPKFCSTKQECQDNFSKAWKEISSIVTYGFEEMEFGKIIVTLGDHELNDFEETLNDPTEIDTNNSIMPPAPMKGIVHGTGKGRPTGITRTSGGGPPRKIGEE